MGTPEQARTKDGRNRAIARMLRAGFVAAESAAPAQVTVEAIAHHLGLSSSVVQRQLSGERPAQLQLLLGVLDGGGPLAVMGEVVLRQLANAAGLMVAHAPVAEEVRCDWHAFAALGAGAGDVLGELGAALEDGVVDGAEAARLETALTALIDRAVAYRERVRVVRRNGPDGVRTRQEPLAMVPRDHERRGKVAL